MIYVPEFKANAAVPHVFDAVYRDGSAIRRWWDGQVFEALCPERLVVSTEASAEDAARALAAAGYGPAKEEQP